MNYLILTLLLCCSLNLMADDSQSQLNSGFYRRPEWKLCELKNYDHWIVSVSTRQHTLGCCIVTARRPYVEKISELNEEELIELKLAMQELELALSVNSKFQPDRFNYLQLGNGLHQLHFHVIPRYATSREFAGIEWVDQTYGNVPVWSKDKPGLDVILQIRDSLLSTYPE